MALSDVKTDGSWIKTYDEKGKHISTMSSSGKDVVGIGSDFFVCVEGSWIKTYDEKCKHIATMSSSNKIVRGGAGSAFTVKKPPPLARRRHSIIKIKNQLLFPVKVRAGGTGLAVVRLPKANPGTHVLP